MRTLYFLMLAALVALPAAPAQLSAQTAPATPPAGANPGDANPGGANHGGAGDVPSASSPATPAAPVGASEVPGQPLDGAAGPYLAARAAAIENDFVAAAKWYGDTLAHDPDDVVLQDSYLVSLVSAGQLARAIDFSIELVNRDASTPLARIVERAEFVHQGDWQAVLDSIAAAPGDEGPGGGALLDGMLRAWALLGAGKATEAMAAFENIQQVPGAEAMAQYHLGLARASVGDYEGANEVMSRPGVSAHLLGLVAQAQVLSQLDRNADAIALIDKLDGIENEPMLVEMRRRLEAGETLPFDAIRTPADGVAQVFLTFASALATGEDPDPLALIHARLAGYIAPDLGEARLIAAQILQSVGQFDLAEHEFGALAKTGEVRPIAELARIEALVQAERMADAESAARALTSAQPDLPSAWTSLGDLLRQQDKWADAVTAYDRALELLTKAGEKQATWFPLYARGIALERSGQFDRSDADMRAALELQPDHASILNYLGYSWVDRNVNLDEGLRLIERAVELRPDDGYILDSLGWAYYRLGRYDDAVRPMERAVAAMSDDSLVNDHMGDVYWQAGREREATVQWRRALSLWTEDDTDTDRDRIRAKIEVGLDAVLAAEKANGGKLPAGFGLPKDPPPTADAGDGAGDDDAADGAADSGASGDQVDDTPPAEPAPDAAPDASAPDTPAPAGDEPVPPRP